MLQNWMKIYTTIMEFGATLVYIVSYRLLETKDKTVS